MLMKSSMKKAGYISEIKSIISELTQYRIAPEQLDVLIGQENQPPLFRHKMRDIQTMYQGFIDYLEGKFVTAEEVLEVLSQVADQSKLLKNSVLLLDGFTGFTPVQYHLLERLFSITGEILVTVTLDAREDPYLCRGVQELFYMSKKTVQALTQIAVKKHVEIKEPVWMKHGARTRFAHARRCCGWSRIYFVPSRRFVMTPASLFFSILC